MMIVCPAVPCLDIAPMLPIGKHTFYHFDGRGKMGGKLGYACLALLPQISAQGSGG